jgi:VWFA-related protein
MNVNRLRRLCIGLTALLVLVSCPLLAQQVTSVPSPAPQQPEPSNGGFKISVGVDVVLVSVVVRDAQGRAVGNLTKEDFQVFDRGKPRRISGFTIETRRSGQATGGGLAASPDETRGAGAVAPAPALTPSAPATASSSVTTLAASLPKAAEPRCSVLLFDDMHLSEGDLMRAKAVGAKILATPLGEREAAAVVSMSGSNSGLTRDRAKLQDAVEKLQVKNLYRHVGRECPDISYYEADRIQNKHEGTAIEAAIADYQTCSNSAGATHDIAQRFVESAASRALALGDQDARTSLAFVAEVVRRMGTLPGRRTLILVSPGFLTITPESMAEKSAILNMAAQANVTISALDARGLYTTEMDASEQGVKSQLSLITGSDAESHRESTELTGSVLGELADGTGGTYFHNSNDLQGGLQRLFDGPEYVYVLEFSLDDAKRDGSYHSLTVKVNRPGLRLQARRGYFAPKPAKNKKQ